MWDGHTGEGQRLPAYRLPRSPALRGQEQCPSAHLGNRVCPAASGKNLPADARRECRISANWRARQSVSKRWRRGLVTSDEIVATCASQRLWKRSHSEGVNGLRVTLPTSCTWGICLLQPINLKWLREFEGLYDGRLSSTVLGEAWG